MIESIYLLIELCADRPVVERFSGKGSERMPTNKVDRQSSILEEREK